ncbi:hypothetical protein SpCBS45565_g01734 [Spizellomyces sp. 'palustris']|nr:hypothetical protein SpCBS45565_g01734 [Spizellomyces sp. 'palustris']
MSSAKVPVVIVTGASRGIGLAVTRILLSLNARVVGLGRSPSSAHPELEALIPSHSTSFCYLSLDVTAHDAASIAVDSAVKKFGRLDAVVHNAGILDPIARVADADLDAWRRCLEVNFFAGISIFQQAANYLRNANGKFILVSSGAAAGAKEGWVPYCTAKAASNMLIAGLGLEEQNIVSVALRPGVVDTDMQTLIRETGRTAMGDASHDQFVQFKEQGKLLHPDVPGYVIAKLALDAPKELSGQFISWNDAKLAAFQNPKTM